MASLRPIKPPVGAGGKKKPVQPRKPLEMLSNQEQYQNRDQARKSDRIKPPVGAGPKKRPVVPRPRSEEVQLPNRQKQPKPSAGVTRAYATYREHQRKAANLNLSNLSPAERAGKGGKSGMARPSMNNARPPANRRTRPVQPPQRRGMR